MARVIRIPLSFSDAGRMIVATEATDVPVHRAISGQSGFDEVWLWVVNRHTSAILLTLGWGSTAAGDSVVINIGANSLTLALAGWTLSNENLLTVNCPADGGYTNPISVYGHVNRFFQVPRQIGPEEGE